MNKHLEEYTYLTKFLKDILPGIYDIIVVDFMAEGYPIIEQSNWSSPNSEPMRRAIVEAFEAGHHRKMESSMAIQDDRLIKLNHFFIEEDGNVIGGFCIGMECDVVLKSMTLLQEMVGEQFWKAETDDAAERENVELHDIRGIVESFGEDPTTLTVDEKKELFCDLYDLGVFRLKGAVAEVANVMNLSEKSVYRYLSEIRKARN